MHEGEHDGTMPMSLRALPRGSGGSRSRAIPVASSAVSSSSQPLPLPSPSPSPSSRSRLFTLLLGPYALALTIYTLWQQSAGPLLGVERGGLGVVAASSRMIVAFWSKGSSGGAEFWNPSLAHGPLTVLAISPARTSSTVAFNLARILLERLDPSTASGWELDLVGLKNLEKGGEWEATLLQDVLGPARAGRWGLVDGSIGGVLLLVNQQ